MRNSSPSLRAQRCLEEAIMAAQMMAKIPRTVCQLLLLGRRLMYTEKNGNSTWHLGIKRSRPWFVRVPGWQCAWNRDHLSRWLRSSSGSTSKQKMLTLLAGVHCFLTSCPPTRFVNRPRHSLQAVHTS